MSVPVAGEALSDYRRLLAERIADTEACRRLAAYAVLLERWSAVHNLVRFASRRELVERHLMDSLAGAARLGECGRLVDVGSGAGLPGIPLLVARPRWRGVLLEPRQKRWAFLRAAVRELGLAAEVEACRFEDAPADLAGLDRICARALGRHRELLEWAAGRLGAGGRVLLWTTEDGAAELARAGGWRVVLSPLPGLERGRLAELEPCFT